MTDAESISSPSATGGGGPYFEQHVGAYWLALLLVESCPPILIDTVIRKVSFQTEHLGWHTDDALITCDPEKGGVRRIACQVKKALSVGAEDEDFQGTILDAWQDFNGSIFGANDAFAIVTQRGTNVILRDLATLFDTARTSSSAADFAHRLTTPGLVSRHVRRDYGVIETIVDAHEGSPADRDRVWRFLRRIYVLPFDLNTDTAQTEAQIRTILARTVSAGEPLSGARNTWNELLHEVSSGAPKAQEYERKDLPPSVLGRHSITAPDDRRALRRLAQHTNVILAGIETKIDGIVHLPRAAVVTDVLAHLEQSRILLLTGTAGSGKSAIAKDIATALGRDHFVFAFRAEEFAQPHVDAALNAVGLGVTGDDFAALMDAQPRKVLVVESVERILEAATRDAFTDLLRFVRDDPTWRLIITCRDYSVDVLRVAFLDAQAVAHATVGVPPLSDDELSVIANDIPIVARLLANGRMKALLRNAYVLQMAVRIPWSEREALPETERDFRRRFWSHFVRADDRRDRGMPQRRATTFTEICVRRAKALTLFAPVAGLDAEAVDALEHYSLVVFSADNRNAVAPAHDVLEDWGVVEWIDETYQRVAGDLVPFAEALGGAPAIRRTYRTWVAEFLDRDAGNADALFAAAIAAADVPHHFRDDTIIAFLRSPRAPELLQRHTTSLFADDKRLFRRIAHLLRVGCVRLPPWAPAAMAASLLFQPEGAAWAAVLQLVREHLHDFDGRDRQLLLGLVEDWAKGVSAETPRPDGHEAAAAITLWLIPFCSDYNSEKLLKRAISVLAKIPASDPEGFERVLRGRDDELRDRAAERLQEILFDEIEGYAASRDLPAIVIAAGKDYFLAREEELDDRYHSPIDIDSFFGMRRSHGSHLPPSAYRGPFRALLREHPKDGRDFIVDLLNYSGNWYGERRGSGHDLEEAWEIELTFADGTTKKQWANPRLWSLYRGTTVTPYPLQSAAMALEAWFFDVAAQQKNLLDPLLLQTLRMSDSVAVTAIVASVAVRYPYASGETLLVLLSSPDCIRMDRMRMAQDQTGSVYSRLPHYETLNEIFAKERADSDALEHRRRDLEMAIAQLQASPFAERVHAALDAHLAALPPIAEQTEDDQVWRIALHRMDLRKYRVASEDEVPPGSAPDSAGENYIVLTPEDPEPDLKAMMQRTAEEYSRVSSRLSDQMWGVKIFERTADDHYDAGEWRARLTTVRSAPAPGDLREQMLFGDAPTIIAAVCVRDRWDELTAEERSWCGDRIVAAVRDTGSDWSDLPRMPGVMGGTMPAAAVIPLLVDRSDGAAEALDALAAALTHPQAEVRVAAARAAGDVLWPRHRDVCLRAMDALRVEADALDDAFGFRGKRRYLDPAEAARVRSGSAEAARRIIRADSAAPHSKTTAVASDGWFAAEAALERASIALGAPDEPSSIAVFSEIASSLVAWWHADRHDRSDRRERRSFETEHALEKMVAEALFRVTDANTATVAAPLLAAVDDHPEKVNSIVESLTFREDRDPATARYWALWRMFAERAAVASWLPDVDEQYSDGKQYLTAVFLASNWKDTTRDWKSLTGHAEEVHRLFERLPLSRTSLHRYLLFLYHVGEQSLPQAFVWLHEKVRDADVPELLTERDSAFVLESLLLRYVYAKPLELKRQHDLRAAVLFLLDALVETGSSSAFRMRDDFVTPIRELPPVAASSERGASALSAG